MGGSESTNSEFVSLLTDTQLRLRAYLVAMVRSDQEADDLLQEVNITLWSKRDQFDRDRPFYAWAYGVAFLEVLRHRRRRATDRLCFGEPVLEQIAEEFVHQGGRFDDRREALAGCLGRLGEDDRWLFESRYRDGMPADQLSRLTGKPLKTIYSTLARIRDGLFRCIERAVAMQEHPSR